MAKAENLREPNAHRRGSAEFLLWMKANADAAWRNRRPTDNIMGHDWTVPVGSRTQSQSATSVAVVLCFADDEPKR